VMLAPLSSGVTKPPAGIILLLAAYARKNSVQMEPEDLHFREIWIHTIKRSPL
jgi:hypothetical protein